MHGGKLFLSWVGLQQLDINALVINIDDLGCCHHYIKNVLSFVEQSEPDILKHHYHILKNKASH